jgi:SAM-dependent methyltransferase
MRLNDPAIVQREYADETGLLGRRFAYRWAEGPDPRELAFQAIAEIRPARVLEVGSGPGEAAARMAQELGAEVVAVDISPRMVQLAGEKGIDARLGDVEHLPFESGSFDAVLAAHVLHHVPDIHRAIGEIARVLRPGGRLVATTNGAAHWAELYALLGIERPLAAFPAETAAEDLRRHFAHVEARPATGTIAFPGRDEAQAFVASTMTLSGELPDVPSPFRVTRSVTVFVADT